MWARCSRDLPVGEAFTVYEASRRARVTAQAARVNNDKAAGPVARVLRDLLFPIAMRTFYDRERMMGRLHRHSIDGDA
jgi:FAD-dependent urate hydroxylase